MDELKEGVKQYGIAIFYDSPTVSREDFECKNEHNYEGHESVAPYMSPAEEDREDKDAEKGKDEDDNREENSFPFRPHGPIERYLSKSVQRTAGGREQSG